MGFNVGDNQIGEISQSWLSHERVVILWPQLPNGPLPFVALRYSILFYGH